MRGYDRSFWELVGVALDMIPTPYLRAKKFRNGLRRPCLCRLVVTLCKDFENIVQIAEDAEEADCMRVRRFGEERMQASIIVSVAPALDMNVQIA